MRIVSWNIHWGCGKDGRIRIHAIIDVLRKLNPDVICLQEVAVNHPELEGNANANQSRQIAGAFGGYQSVYAPTSEIYKNNLPRLFGNFLLSKHRVTLVLRHSLPWPADPGRPPGMPRGMIEAVIDAPGRKLRVLTTHLEYYSEAQRLAQVHHIRFLHREACERAQYVQQDPTLEAPFQVGQRPASAIYCGDFNCKPHSPAYRALLEPNAVPLVDAWVLKHGTKPHPPTAGLHGFHWPEKPDCYDYFFLTEDLADRISFMDVHSETSASDHQPIVIDID